NGFGGFECLLLHGVLLVARPQPVRFDILFPGFVPAHLRSLFHLLLCCSLKPLLLTDKTPVLALMLQVFLFFLLLIVIVVSGIFMDTAVGHFPYLIRHTVDEMPVVADE